MSKEDKWAEQLRHKMDDYAEPLPEGMWKKIEQDMPAPRVVPLWRSRWSYAAAVMVLAVSSLTIWLWNSSPVTYVAEQTQQHEQLIQAVGEQVDRAKDILTGNENASQLAETETVGLPGHDQLTISVRTDKQTPMLAASYADAVPLIVDDSPETEECEADSRTDSIADSMNREQNRKSLMKARVVADRKVMERNARNMNKPARKRKKGTWDLGISAGNIPYSSSQSGANMRSMSPHVLYMYVEDANSKLKNSSNVMAVNDIETEVKHKMPIVVSASFRYQFTPHWGLESGLSYTLLSSEWKSPYGVNVNQKLHYFGIPLKVNYNIWNSRFMTFYASAGGKFEKCFSAELNRYNGNEGSLSSGKIEEKPLQWSLMAAVGAQFNVVRHFGLFVEPGVTYYFDDNSVYQTIRKEHPFNFNLNLGLRFTFGRQ